MSVVFVGVEHSLSEEVNCLKLIVRTGNFTPAADIDLEPAAPTKPTGPLLITSEEN